MKKVSKNGPINDFKTRAWSFFTVQGYQSQKYPKFGNNRLKWFNSTPTNFNY